MTCKIKYTWGRMRARTLAIRFFPLNLKILPHRLLSYSISPNYSYLCDYFKDPIGYKWYINKLAMKHSGFTLQPSVSSSVSCYGSFIGISKVALGSDKVPPERLRGSEWNLYIYILAWKDCCVLVWNSHQPGQKHVMWFHHWNYLSVMTLNCSLFSREFSVATELL